MKTKPRITAAVLAVLMAPEISADDALAHVITDLEGAGVEETHRHPEHGHQTVDSYLIWFYDGEDARYETN